MISFGCKFYNTNLVDEYLKDWNFVLEGFEKGLEAQVIAEVDPLLPLSDASGGSTRSNSVGDCFRINSKMIAEINTDGGVQTLYPRSCDI